MPRPFRQLREPYAFVRQFTPNWFTINMGTGILYMVVLALPFHFKGRAEIATILWGANGFVFTINTLLFLARGIFFPGTIMPLLRHPVQSMFLGAIPMGLTPLVNGLVLLGQGQWNVLAEYLWWFNAVLALGAAWGVPYLMFTQQGHSTEKMTAVWLLPIVGPEVVAAGGGVIAPYLLPASAQLMLAASYVLWAVSLLLAFSIITLLVLRLVLHKLPPADMAATSWLPLGPIGTGSLGLLVIGQAAPQAFLGSKLMSVALLARDFGLLGGFLLWGFGLWWLVMALLFTRRYLRQPLPFNMGWWGFTFPLGVYTAATLGLYHLSGFLLFAILGCGLAAVLGVVWLIVAAQTCRGIWHGSLFYAPCLAKPED